MINRPSTITTLSGDHLTGFSSSTNRRQGAEAARAEK